MSGNGYNIKIQALHAAQGAFEDQSTAVTHYQERFRAEATLHRSAFGKLRQSEEVAAQYDAFVNRVLTDMGTLSNALNNASNNLGANAANYTKVEQANIIAP